MGKKRKRKKEEPDDDIQIIEPPKFNENDATSTDYLEKLLEEQQAKNYYKAYGLIAPAANLTPAKCPTRTRAPPPPPPVTEPEPTTQEFQRFYNCPRCGYKNYSVKKVCSKCGRIKE
eukprot:Platyproteum_vivax@DN2029_c0_g1_i1.p1